MIGIGLSRSLAAQRLSLAARIKLQIHDRSVVFWGKRIASTSIHNHIRQN